jgi:hypothetical protein
VSRDPIGERAGRNLCRFCRNNGINRRDLVGALDFEYTGDLVWGNCGYFTWDNRDRQLNAGYS